MEGGQECIDLTTEEDQETSKSVASGHLAKTGAASRTPQVAVEPQSCILPTAGSENRGKEGKRDGNREVVTSNVVPGATKKKCQVVVWSKNSLSNKPPKNKDLFVLKPLEASDTEKIRRLAKKKSVQSGPPLVPGVKRPLWVQQNIDQILKQKKKKAPKKKVGLAQTKKDLAYQDILSCVTNQFFAGKKVKVKAVSSRTEAIRDVVFNPRSGNSTFTSNIGKSIASKPRPPQLLPPWRDLPYDGVGKPPYSYNELIQRALHEGNNLLSVSEIYTWISENFPYYELNDDRWKNSIRHNLSICENFEKIERPEGGVGGLWTVRGTPRDPSKSRKGTKRAARVETSVGLAADQLDHSYSEPQHSEPQHETLIDFSKLVTAPITVTSSEFNNGLVTNKPTPQFNFRYEIDQFSGISIPESGPFYFDRSNVNNKLIFTRNGANYDVHFKTSEREQSVASNVMEFHTAELPIGQMIPKETQERPSSKGSGRSTFSDTHNMEAMHYESDEFYPDSQGLRISETPEFVSPEVPELITLPSFEELDNSSFSELITLPPFEELDISSFSELITLPSFEELDTSSVPELITLPSVPEFVTSPSVESNSEEIDVVTTENNQ